VAELKCDDQPPVGLADHLLALRHNKEIEVGRKFQGKKTAFDLPPPPLYIFNTLQIINRAVSTLK
jgi:hypothetical protein